MHTHTHILLVPFLWNLMNTATDWKVLQNKLYKSIGYMEVGINSIVYLKVICELCAMLFYM